MNQTLFVLFSFFFLSSALRADIALPPKTKTSKDAKTSAPALSEAHTSVEAVTQKKLEQATSFSAPTDADNKHLKAIDTKYQKAKSVTMDVEKTMKLSVLGREQKSQGKIQISRGRMRMETPDESLLVINKKTLWVVTYPDPDLKKHGAAIQVLTGNIDSKQARSKSLLGLLTQGGLLKFFTVSSVEKDKAKDQSTFFLQPKKELVEFKRAKVTVSNAGLEIKTLRFWDQLDNESRFDFKNIEFNKAVDAKVFDYKPPQGADIMPM